MMEKEWASLGEICEEKRVSSDPETGAAKSVPACFVSMRAMLEGALAFVGFFERIHGEGAVYGSTAADPFRFDLKEGTMRFDAPGLLVSMEAEGDAAGPEPDGASFPVNEFLAPELVLALDEAAPEENVPDGSASGEAIREGKTAFSMETDRYFMAVFLFEYFFHTGSPFEGRRMVNRCFLSPLEKERYRAREGRFCMEEGEHDNRPAPGIQDKLLRYWTKYPESLRKMFQRAFLDAGRNCELRPTEVDWKQLLLSMMMDYKTCGCGFSGFADALEKWENGTLSCPGCGKIYYPLSNGMDRILLAEGEKLYACQTGKNPYDKDTVTGIVTENRQRKGLYGIKNVSRGVWKGLYPGGTVREIAPGQGIPIWNGMMIRFERGEEWSLRLIRTGTDVHLPGRKEEMDDEQQSV